MHIGFDAKRAFHNGTGLGHYSRTLLQSLDNFFPEHEYYLFNPRPSRHFWLEGTHLHEVQPTGFINKLFPAAWRSSRVKADFKKYKIDIYHGLSHEIPIGIRDTGVRSVVTMHDLIHERYPEQYNAVDVRIYRKKFRYACKYADHIIAISEQTRRDLVEIYNTPEEKITVCYQSCNPAFATILSTAERERIRTKYGLPPQYFLYVGSLIERKNLLNICKALFLLREKLTIPLVVIGNGGKYKQVVQDYLQQQGMADNVIFLSDNGVARTDSAFITAADFPAIYQGAIAMIYPSVFEGFGIPVLEALWSKVPVITSNVSCLPEAGGDAAFYVNPQSAEEIAAAMLEVYSDPAKAELAREKGKVHAERFSPQACAAAVMNVYTKL